MNYKICSILLVCVLFVSGCSPTQKIAAEAMQRGIDTEHTIVVDLSTLAKQSILNRFAAEAKLAAAAGDESAAQKVVERLVTEWDRIGWLEIQHERARSMVRIGQVYIWSQKGIFTIIKEEWDEAKKTADENKTESK